MPNGEATLDVRTPVDGAAPWAGAPVPASEAAVAVAGLRGDSRGAVRPDAARTPFVPGETTVDAVAAYFPWHFYNDSWGIRIYERELLGYVDLIADAAGCSVDD